MYVCHIYIYYIYIYWQCYLYICKKSALFINHLLWSCISRVFENLSSDGLVPDIMTYTQVCGACARGGRWKEALQLLTDCEEKRGLVPDAYCYGQ